MAQLKVDDEELSFDSLVCGSGKWHFYAGNQ